MFYVPFLVGMDRLIKSITCGRERNMMLCLGLNYDLKCVILCFSVYV